MRDNVIPIGGVTKLDIDPDAALEGCKGQLDGVIIIGISKEGHLHFASSIADGAEILWYVEQFKAMLLELEE